MRIDKFLKVSRLIKRRTLAKEVASSDRITVNGKIVKPSFVIQINDQIEIRMGNKIVGIKVNEIKDSTKKEDALSMYELLYEKTIQESK